MELPERETLRLHQANERTYLAWIRTALAMMGFGFVVARVGLVHVPGAVSIGVALSLLASASGLASIVRYRRVSSAIERHEVGQQGGDAWILAIGAVIALSGAALAGLLLTPG